MRTSWPAVTSLILLLLVNCPCDAAARTRRLYPVDEGVKDASFARFRRELRAAVKRRDTQFVLRILDPAIMNSFGGNCGVADFREQWHPERPRSELWPTLDEILSLGGSFSVGESASCCDPNATGVVREFCAPYVFSCFPDDLEGYEYMAITGRSVRLRQKPSLRSRVIGTLTYEIVRYSGEESGRWVGIVTCGGRHGYVSARYVRSPIDYRARFGQVKGHWVMKALVAGD